MRFFTSFSLLHKFQYMPLGSLVATRWLTQLGLAIGCVGWMLPIATTPARAAERIYVAYSILERSIPVASLETYAKKGTIDDDLAAYARYANPEVLKQLRGALVARADLSPIAISQFLYSPQGEVLLKRIGQVIQSESRISGFKAIRAALILSSADPEGLTLLNVLRKFPTRGIRIDVERSLRIVADLQKLVNQTNRATSVVTQQSTAEIATDPPIPPSPPAADLRMRGPFTWQKQTLTLTDPNRKPVTIPGNRSPSPIRLLSEAIQGRSFQVDLYLPDVQILSKPAPVVVISHGLGSDRNTFVYLAQHLASYGFVVLVPEHPGSNTKQMEALINGTASEVAEPSEFADRPLDITYLLNQMEQRATQDPALQGRMNLKQVGVIGQSFGGYTALALAGAPINFQQLQSDCKDLENTFNLSLLLQCRALELGKTSYTLQDPRVKAVIALNPITSAVLGKASLSQINVPTMIVTGNADTIAPALTEQIQPFTWLTTENRYLVLMDQGTHFSTINGVEQGNGTLPIPPEIVGPNPAAARRYVNALSLAFFQTYIAEKPDYLPYLTASYARSISEVSPGLSLLHRLEAEKVAQK